MNEKNIKIIDTDCRHMRVQVPTSVHVKELVRGLNLTPTRSENLKNKIYYFLSRIVSTNDNFKLNEKNDGYRKISSVIMRKVMGRKDYYLIIKLLTNPDDPIVEINKSYRNSKSCKGYRITQKYNNGKVEYKTIPKKSHERIIKHIPAVSEGELISDRYQFLLDQFQLNTFSFDQMAFEYIRTFGNNLLSRVEDNNEYQTKMVLNLIGRWLYYVEKIENNDLWYKVSPDNHRLNSSITSLKRTLRPFLLCKGKRLEMIDISSSQPYFLSSVMNIGSLQVLAMDLISDQSTLNYLRNLSTKGPFMKVILHILEIPLQIIVLTLILPATILYIIVLIPSAVKIFSIVIPVTVL